VRFCTKWDKRGKIDEAISIRKGKGRKGAEDSYGEKGKERRRKVKREGNLPDREAWGHLAYSSEEGEKGEKRRGIEVSRKHFLPQLPSVSDERIKERGREERSSQPKEPLISPSEREMEKRRKKKKFEEKDVVPGVYLDSP